MRVNSNSADGLSTSEIATQGDGLVSSTESKPMQHYLMVVLWGFPEPSQTFIQRELEEMHRQGCTVNMLAGHRVHRTDISPELEDIASRGIYLGHPAAWAIKGLGYAARHPVRFTSTLWWGVRLPHRTLFRHFRIIGLLLAAASVADRVRAMGFTYIHAHFASYHTEFAMCLSRLTGIPYGFTGHATGIWKDRNILAEKIADARVVLTCTRHNADHLRSLAPAHAEKVHLLFHGLAFERLPEPTPLPSGSTTYFTAIGRLVTKKGFTYLLDAAALLRDRGHDIHVNIIGDGPERERLTAQIERLGLQEHVTMLGAMPNRDVWDVLLRSHALVAPSVQAADGNMDGIPNVTLEAMAMARPVIGTELSGIPEVVIPGKTGLLAPPADAEALADAMAYMATHHEEAAAMGQEARAFVRAHFDLTTNTRVQIELLGEAAERAVLV